MTKPTPPENGGERHEQQPQRSHEESWQEGERRLRNLAAGGRLAVGSQRYGPAFVHWASHVGIDNIHELDRFEETYEGMWRSTSEYAEHLYWGLGYGGQLTDTIPDRLRPFAARYCSFDADLFAADLVANGLFVSPTGDGFVHLFQTE